VTVYHVYAIGTKDILKEPYSDCYVGVSKNTARRWSEHKCSNRNIGLFIRQEGLVREEHMVVIFTGTWEECLKVESEMRPWPNMGLNMSKGGFGGDFFKGTST
jgi:predicted GIY-YIG superfamily endonuclease